jgi:hypothetical protein
MSDGGGTVGPKHWPLAGEAEANLLLAVLNPNSLLPEQCGEC